MKIREFFNEFETFAIKGNAIDLAVGVVIGTAFGAITASLVEDIFNPIFGLLTGQIDFSDKTLVLREATETSAAVAIRYGEFINTLLNFILVAFALFIVVRQLNKFRKRIEEKLTKPVSDQKPAALPADIKLLTEIRDELRSKK